MTMSGRSRARSRVLRGALPVVLLVAALSAGPSAAAAETGSVQGKVVNGTQGPPVADVDVRLQLFGQQGDLGTLTATTNKAGAFSFTDLPDGVAGYQLSATYEGAVYRTISATFTSGQAVEQDVTVYEPTTDVAAVTLTDYIVWLDREGDGVALQHDLAWSNGGDTAFVGGDGGGGGNGGGTTVSVPLPEGATNLQFLGTFLESPGDVQGQTYLNTAPIVPGTSSATLRYNAPALSRLTLSLGFATTSLQLFVPQDVTVTATALRLAGTITDQGQTYSVYAADNVAAGTTIDVAMSQTEAASPASSATWILLGAAALVLLIGVAVWLIGRRRRARAPKGKTKAAARATPSKASGRTPERAARATGNGKAEPEATEEDAELLIEEIAALDLSFEHGLLDERTYKRLRVSAKDRLLRAEGARSKGGRAR